MRQKGGNENGKKEGTHFLKNYLGLITEEEIPFVTVVYHENEIKTIIEELENPENH